MLTSSYAIITNPYRCPTWYLVTSPTPAATPASTSPCPLQLAELLLPTTEALYASCLQLLGRHAGQLLQEAPGVLRGLSWDALGDLLSLPLLVRTARGVCGGWRKSDTWWLLHGWVRTASLGRLLDNRGGMLASS